MTKTAQACRGEKHEITFHSRPVLYTENGFRSVPLEETLETIERFFLTTEIEVQFDMQPGQVEECRKAVLHVLDPRGKEKDRYHFGKGTTAGQTLASACVEFMERFCAGLRPEDVLVGAPYQDVRSHARDPRLFSLAPEAAFDDSLVIDWVWGYSLTESEPVLVPANLVFCPYETSPGKTYIAWIDSNGLASGNNIEEAVLHGILEIVERDALVINEYNRLPLDDISPETLPDSIRPLVDRLDRDGFLCFFKGASTDIPIPTVAAFLTQESDPSHCAMAFGCHLDPSLALSRSLTEAVQLLPPTVNHKEWLASGSPALYTAKGPRTVSLNEMANQATSDLAANIEICIEILARFAIEVIFVDLSLPEVPFPTVRVLATNLQPLCHKEDMRLSKRFFQVPLTLGYRDKEADLSEVEIWPICGFR